MSLLGNTFEEKYTNFFKFFSAKHTKSELANFIKENKIPPYSNSIFQKINLNMLDNQNLNILFHIIIRSDSDSDCLEKLKYLIEEQNLDTTCSILYIIENYLFTHVSKVISNQLNTSLIK